MRISIGILAPLLTSALLLPAASAVSAQTTYVDPKELNTGTLDNGLRFGTAGGVSGDSVASTRVIFPSGQGIASNHASNKPNYLGLDFFTQNVVRLSITKDGQVNVPGTVAVKTLQIVGGADLAEPFDMSGAASKPGSVVVIDGARPGGLTLSEHAYDRRVAGVVSGAGGISPGISMQPDASQPAGTNVALSGRVYALADADGGSIQPGDLLTTSDRKGHCMKVLDPTRASGAVLGKAMTGLAKGQGLVLVLVTLQ